MDDEVPGVLPPQVPHLGCRESLVGVTQHRELLEDINNTDGPHQECCGECKVDHLDGGELPQQVGHVGDEVAGEHELEDVRREVVVKEKCSVVEKVRNIMCKIACEKHLPSLTIVFKLSFVNVKTQPTPSEQIKKRGGPCTWPCRSWLCTTQQCFPLSGPGCWNP